MRSLVDHLRNHGFLLKSGRMDEWGLSPSFDVNPDFSKDHMTLSIGDGTEKSLANALEIADFFRLNQIEAKEHIRTLRRVIRENWEREADRIGIGHQELERMRPAFDEAYR